MSAHMRLCIWVSIRGPAFISFVRFTDCRITSDHRWCWRSMCNSTRCARIRIMQPKILRHKPRRCHHGPETHTRKHRNVILFWKLTGFVAHTTWYGRTLAYRYVPNVTQMPTIKKTIANAKNRKPRLRANSGPTDDTLRQCGHLANALFSVLNFKWRR